MYGVLTDHKYDPDHIIVLMVDDLPDSSHNPFPGTIYNHPGDHQRNYHDGLVVDYDKSVKINVELYSAILLGDADKVTELTGIKNPKVVSPLLRITSSCTTLITEVITSLLCLLAVI